MANITFIIPTIGRESLQATLDSIDAWEGDEVIVKWDIPPSGKWGNPQRNEAMAEATCPYLAFIDDDDWYADDARYIMDEAIKDSPNQPILFKIEYPNGNRIWKEKKIIPGNISTQMILVPNDKDKLYHWEGGRNMADFIFVDKWKWADEEIVWRPEVIALMGHDDKGKL